MKQENPVFLEVSEWVTPLYVKMKKIKIKRISPYPENELWEKDEILAIVKYELYINNKKN